MWPFLKCCSCARSCLGLNKKRKDENDISVSEEGKADVQDEAVVYEGGDVESDEGGDEEDPENGLGTDRSLDVNGHLDRVDRYRVDDRYLETDDNLQGGKKKKNKINFEEDESEEDQQKVKKQKKKRKVYNTPIEDLWYFARVWRALQSKYCKYCENELLNHHEEFVCDLGHILHVKCAKVKWVGNKVCPICVKQPEHRPKYLDKNFNKNKAVLEEEIESSEMSEIPKKPQIM